MKKDNLIPSLLEKDDAPVDVIKRSGKYVSKVEKERMAREKELQRLREEKARCDCNCDCNCDHCDASSREENKKYREWKEGN